MSVGGLRTAHVTHLGYFDAFVLERNADSKPECGIRGVEVKERSQV